MNIHNCTYKTIIVLLILLWRTDIHSQLNNITGGARQLGVAGCSTTLTDVWSAFGNQASLALLEKNGVSVSYHNKFSLKELNSILFSTHYKLYNTTFALSTYRYGFTEYNENRVSFSASKLIFKNFSTGIQTDYYFIKTPNLYNNIDYFSFQMGFLYNFNQKVIIGIHLSNLFRANISNSSNNSNNIVAKSGINYSPSENISLLYEIEKNFDSKLNNKFGMEYTAFEHFVFRCGYTSPNDSFSLGGGYKFKSFEINIGYKYHPMLKDEKQFSLTYIF